MKISKGTSLALLVVGACRQDMHDLGREKPLCPSDFFADGKSARELVAGTVPRGFGTSDPSYYTGRKPGAPKPQPPGSPPPTGSETSGPAADREQPAADREQLAAWRALAAAQALRASAEPEESQFVPALPFPLTWQVLERGQQRYDIFCAPCHDRTGSGDGLVVRKGFSRPPVLYSERLRSARLGHLFAVITEGFGSMPSYASQLSAADRWAVVSYVRALQLSQGSRLADLPDPEQRAFAQSLTTGSRR